MTDTLWFYLPWLVCFWIFFLRPLHCPSCQGRVSRVKDPTKKTREEWSEGFATCPHCGAEFYSNGKLRDGLQAKKEIQKNRLLLYAAMLLMACTMGFALWYYYRIQTRASVPTLPAPPAIPAAPPAT